MRRERTESTVSLFPLRNRRCNVTLAHTLEVSALPSEKMTAFQQACNCQGAQEWSQLFQYSKHGSVSLSKGPNCPLCSVFYCSSKCSSWSAKYFVFDWYTDFVPYVSVFGYKQEPDRLPLWLSTLSAWRFCPCTLSKQKGSWLLFHFPPVLHLWIRLFSTLEHT